MPFLACGAACALLALMGLAMSPARAQPADPLFPAADCAALWLGYADVTGDAGAAELGRAFAAVALRIAEDTGAMDRANLERRRGMALTAEAMIHLQDRESREVFEGLARDCEDFGLGHPETRPLIAGPSGG